jgi:hypothetical protein
MVNSIYIDKIIVAKGPGAIRFGFGRKSFGLVVDPRSSKKIKTHL